MGLSKKMVEALTKPAKELSSLTIDSSPAIPKLEKIEMKHVEGVSRHTFATNTFYFTKTRNVKSPVRGHDTDAGIDFFIPEDISVKDFKEKCKVTGITPKYETTPEGYISKIVLNQGEAVLIPSGIRVVVPYGFMLQFNNKSGVSSKQGLMVGASVVDVGYDDECHIHLVATYKKPVVISAGQKIVQGILTPVSFAMPEELSSSEVTEKNKIYSDRGKGGFGSTGTA